MQGKENEILKKNMKNAILNQVAFADKLAKK